jgi:hypothetical protein
MIPELFIEQWKSHAHRNQAGEEEEARKRKKKPAGTESRSSSLPMGRGPKNRDI